MSGVPNPPPASIRRRRRRRRSEPSGWKAIPNAAKVLIGLCLVTVIFIPLAKENGYFKRRDAEAPIPEVRQSDLLLGEAQFQAASRKIRGVVVNSSANPYKDVVISYTLKDAQGIDVGVVGANISNLGPHEKATFETEPMPKDAFTYDLREIAGTPR